MKVELDRTDWEEAKQGAVSLLKNAMAQVIVYKGQLETAERELAKFPPEEEPKKKEKKPIGVE